MTRRLTIKHESWPLAEFTISRGSKIAADVVVVELKEDGKIGRGECVPYARYSEAIDGVMAALEDPVRPLGSGVGRQRLRRCWPAPRRNAIDCALWDLEAKAERDASVALAALGAKGSGNRLHLEPGYAGENGDRRRVECRKTGAEAEARRAEDLARVQAVRIRRRRRRR